jgi:hypothetical protein
MLQAGRSVSSVWVGAISYALRNRRRSPKSFGRAKSCILLHLYGSPRTFDMKPAVLLEIGGELKSIRSKLPGLDVCELLPNLAQVMDRCMMVRSMTQPYTIHGVAYALTGVPQIGHFLIPAF